MEILLKIILSGADPLSGGAARAELRARTASC